MIMSIAGHSDSPGLPATVTAENVEAAAHVAGKLAATLNVARDELRQLRRRIAALQRALAVRRALAAITLAILRGRAACERIGLWFGGALFIGTALSTAAAIIVAALLKLSSVGLFVCGTGGAIFGFGALILLLYVPERHLQPPTSEALTRSLAELIWQRQQVEQRLSSVERQHAEALEEYQRLRTAIESRIHRLLTCNWRDLRGIPFEHFLEEVFLELGFQVQTTKTSGDQGVDLVGTCNGFRLAVQAKGYAESVGNSAVQEVVAGRIFYNCHACAVITNSTFTSGAIELASRTNCMLIDGAQIQNLIRGEIAFGESRLAPAGAELVPRQLEAGAETVA